MHARLQNVSEKLRIPTNSNAFMNQLHVTTTKIVPKILATKRLDVSLPSKNLKLVLFLATKTWTVYNMEKITNLKIFVRKQFVQILEAVLQLMDFKLQNAGALINVMSQVIANKAKANLDQFVASKMV